MGDDKDNAEEHIHLKRDEKYIDLLSKDTFSTVVYNCIVKKGNMKQKSKTSKVIQDLHSNSEYITESSSIAVDIHAPSFDIQSLDTRTDNNPFDVVDVM